MSWISELSSVIDSPDAGDPLRAHGLIREPEARPEDFPYDRQQTYGEPAAYDRGSNIPGVGHFVPTPRDTAHSAWDDLEEVLGSPELLSRGSGGGNGGVIPGTSDYWATAPSNLGCPPDDEDEERPRKSFDVEETFLPSPHPPPTEPIPNSTAEYPKDQTDDEIENKLDRIYGIGQDGIFSDPGEFGGGSMLPSDIQAIPSPIPFTQAVGKSLRGARGTYGLIPKESAWDSISQFGRS